MGKITSRINSLKTIFLANDISSIPSNSTYDGLGPGYSRMQLRRTFGSLKRALNRSLIAANVSNAAPIVATSLVDQSVAATQALSYAFDVGSFTDANGQTLTYTATLSSGAALPDWITFTAGTRTFAGTAPAFAGDATDVNTVRVAAIDVLGASVSDDFTITVTA